MADPGTLAMIGLIGTAAVGGAAAYTQSQAAREQGEAVARAARWNAQLAENEAKAEEARRRRVSRRLLATQRARIAASGVQIEGSPLELLASNAAELEIEALTARYRGQTTADLERARARTAQRTARKISQAELLGGAASVGSSLFGAFGGGTGPRPAGPDTLRV